MNQAIKLVFVFLLFSKGINAQWLELDNTFGVNGMQKKIIPTNSNSFQEMLFDQNENYIVLGHNLETGYTNKYFLAKYTNNGILDSSFAINGISPFLENDSTKNFYSSLALQSDGKIIIGGEERDSATNISLNVFVRRFDTLGNIDSSFGVFGYAGIFLNCNVSCGNISDICIQPNNKILICTVGNTDSTSFIVRLNSNGLIDSSFGKFGSLLFRTKKVKLFSCQHPFRSISVFLLNYIFLT